MGMKTVLVAEDDRATRLRLVSFLKDWDYDPIAAADGLEAWNLFNNPENDFGCVITDWIMPEMDGLELVRKIRDRESEHYVYVILLTGRAETRNVVEGMEAGADDFMAKPFERDELRARLRAGQRVVELERRLEERNRELSMFASVASHDLREPLRTISSYLMLLQRNYRGVLDERANEFIDFTTDAAARMSALITDLLDLARLDSTPADYAEVDMREVCDEVLSALRGAIDECGGTVTIGEPLPIIRGNRVFLSQLFQNLIGNGIKYRGHESPVVRFEATDGGENWLFSVTDNGIGIPANQKTAIFEPFQRLHGTNSNYQGSGVGLAICKKVVERHGGHIWVESEPGKGSTFYFTLPKKPLA